MKFLKVAFLFAVIAMVFAPAAARPDFWKDLGKGIERVGQNVRDAVISAGPAVDTIARAQQIAQGGPRDEDQ